jgi:hypothetical protein
MEELKSPAEFLQDYGIEMQKTTLVCCIDDVMKQPSLNYLMKEYADYVLKQYKDKKSE